MTVAKVYVHQKFDIHVSRSGPPARTLKHVYRHFRVDKLLADLLDEVIKEPVFFGGLKISKIFADQP